MFNIPFGVLQFGRRSSCFSGEFAFAVLRIGHRTGILIGYAFFKEVASRRPLCGAVILAAAQDRANAPDELARVEWLSEAVVSPDLMADDPVHTFLQRGD